MADNARFKFDPWAVDKIKGTYNVEDDLPRSPCPRVSWTEYALLQMVLELEGRITDLEARVADSETAFTRHRLFAHGDKG